ncbi:MAG: hypothetical protein O3B86_19515 [Planctomycetota bacterium]|nr:hypothetical protein [Planctomycetota bacterium]
MIPLVTSEDSLRRLFSALTEHTFQVDLGVADPVLTDYLVEMLVRFTRSAEMYRFRDVEGRPLVEVVDMVSEARQRESKPQRELHRHIGDYTLFWSGVFPEALHQLQAVDNKDHLIDYEQQGRESYFIASKFKDDPYGEEAPILRRLSQDFDLVRFGLNRIRQDWDRLPAETAARYESEDSSKNN